VWALLALALLVTTIPVSAQLTNKLYYDIGVSPTNGVAVNGTAVYHITLTNQLGYLLTSVRVTNSLPASVRYVTSTNDFNTTFLQDGTNYVFNVLNFPHNAVTRMALVMRPTTAGYFTNFITLAIPPFDANSMTNLFVVSQATNSTLPLADLGVSITGLPSGAYPFDENLSYRLNVTNSGPGSATNVWMTNTFSTNIVFDGVSPSPQEFSIDRNSRKWTFKLDTLTNTEGQSYRVAFHATNSGPATFTATFRTNGIVDTYLDNNHITNTITIDAFLTNQPLVVTLVSNSYLNFLNGLTELNIRLSNASPAAVESARVTFTGMTNRLFNAVGTNAGKPFVVHGATLGTNQSVILRMLVSNPSHKPMVFYATNFPAVAIGAVDLSPPSTLTTGVDCNRIVILTDLPNAGDRVLEFASTPGMRYTVVYGDDASFANARVAQPPVAATANWTDWIDYGPPCTVSHPVNTTSRFYKIYLTP
jgi:uncharacterized repeat protein (TIGR01451 family)